MKTLLSLRIDERSDELVHRAAEQAQVSGAGCAHPRVYVAAHRSHIGPVSPG